MRRMTLVLTTVVGLALAAGCGGKRDDEKKTEQQAQTENQEAPKEEPKKEPEPTTMINRMANCPNAVAGATTEIGEAEGGVLVTITASEQAAVDEVRKRAKHLQEVDSAGGGSVEHTGKGTGGGALGKCPVVMDNTSIEVAEIENGVRITVKPSDAANLEALRKEIAQRSESMPAAGEGDTAAGEGAGDGDEAGGAE